MNDRLVIWVGAVVTLVVFSYLAGDNPVYRLIQQAALGASVGIALVIAWQQVLEPMWWAPIRGAFQGGSRAGALWLLALVPGAMWYGSLSKKWFWVSTIIFGLFAGVAAGFTFKGIPLLVLPQIGGCLKPLNPFAGPGGFTWQALGDCLNNLLFLAALATTLLYFFFSIRMENRLLGTSVRLGRLMIMVALGAMFGNTVMTRMAYLIERMQFLYENWLAPMWHHGAL